MCPWFAVPWPNSKTELRLVLDILCEVATAVDQRDVQSFLLRLALSRFKIKKKADFPVIYL